MNRFVNHLANSLISCMLLAFSVVLTIIFGCILFGPITIVAVLVLALSALIGVGIWAIAGNR